MSKSKSKAVTFETVKHGYLRDNSGRLYELSKSEADRLVDNNVEPDEMQGMIPVWGIDEGGEVYYRQTRHVNSCVFDATKEYLIATGLGTLTAGDKEFFVNHPRVDSSGVGRGNVLCVIQGLVEPWGVGIDHVWMPKWTSLGDQHKEFAAALGINPMAASDGETSNAELIDKMGLDEDNELAKQIMGCRFEFVDAPKQPCIVLISGSSAVSKSAVTNVGGAWSAGTTGFGHADFLGPRDSIGHSTWQIAVSLTKNPKYDVPMPRYGDPQYFSDELETKENSLLKLSIGQSKINGRTIYSYQSKPKAAPKPQPSAITTPRKWEPPTTKPSVPHGAQYSQSRAITPVHSEGKCDWCGGKAVKVNGIEACFNCNWYKNGSMSALGVICPFCGDYLSDGRCLSGCGYGKDWNVSERRRCKTHQTSVFYKPVSEERGVFLCAQCTRDLGKTPADLFTRRQSTGSELVVERTK